MMKEFSSSMDDGFSSGLRRAEYTSSNSKTLTLLQNARSLGKDLDGESLGLQPIEAITTPAGLSGDPGVVFTVEHPWPQIFRGQNVTLVADKTAIYSIDESTWIPNLISTYEFCPTVENLFNPNFTGASTKWTLGTGWSYSSNSISHSAAGAGSATQAVADQVVAIIAGQKYEITVSVKVDELTELIGGQGIRVHIGTTVGPWFNASGRYRIVLTAAGTTDFAIEADANFVGKIDMLAVRKMNSAVITAGGAWHFVDMGTNWILFNGTCFVAAYIKEYARVFNNITIKTGCDHRGRVLFGGLGADFFTQGWGVGDLGYTDFYTSMVTRTPDNINDAALTFASNSFGKNCVWWSTIGGGDVWGMLLPITGIHGYYGASESTYEGDNIQDRAHELWFDLCQRNEAGWIPMTFKGEVKFTKPLGKSVIVYGEDGICALTLASDPIPTYGRKEISRFGVATRAAVGGNEKLHLVMDSQGDLWVLSEDLSFKKLGYREFFASWAANTAVISYEEELELFWISGGTEAYSWSLAGGLGGPYQQIPTNVIYADVKTVGFYSTDATLTDVKVRTEAWDAGLRALKSIQAVEVGAYLDSVTLASGGLYVAVDYRYEIGDTWTTSEWFPVNGQGVANVQLCGTEFRFYVKCLWDSTKAFPSQKISSLTVRWKLNDKRAIRGIYAAKG